MMAHTAPNGETINEGEAWLTKGRAGEIVCGEQYDLLHVKKVQPWSVGTTSTEVLGTIDGRPVSFILPQHRSWFIAQVAAPRKTPSTR